MDSVTQKVCVGCGKDVSTLKRVRDDAGRYFCQPCYTVVASKVEQPRGSPAATAAERSASTSMPITRAIPAPEAFITKHPKDQDETHMKPRRRSRTRLLVVTVGSLLLVGVIIATLTMLHRPPAGQQSATVSPDENDVLGRPERLKDSTFNADQMKAAGVKVGDDQASVLARKPGLELNQYGSVAIETGVVAVLKDRQVQTIVLSNKDWIKKAGLESYQDVRNVLGKADGEQYSPADELAILHSRQDGKPSPPPSGGLIDCFYLKRGLEIETVDGQTVRVNITARPGTKRLKVFAESIEPFAAILEKQQTDMSVGMTIMNLRSNVQQMAAARKKFRSPPLAWKIAVDFEHDADEAIESYTIALRSWANGGTARNDAMSAASIFARQALSRLEQMRSKLS